MASAPRNRGIKKRPLIYTLMCVFFLIEPIIKMVHLRVKTGFNYSVLMNTILGWENPFQIAEYFLLFPLAGIALIKIRRNTYFLLMLIQLYCIFKILSFTPYEWPYFTKTPIMLMWFFFGINIMAILIFLHPSVRKPFFDRAVRWWESATRYLTDFPCECTVAGGDKKVQSKILNISKSGAFIKGDDYEPGQKINLFFQFLEKEYNFESTVIGHHPFKDQKGMGIRFGFSLGNIIKATKLIWRMKSKGYKPVDGRV